MNFNKSTTELYFLLIFFILAKFQKKSKINRYVINLGVEPKNFVWEGPICVTNLLVYTNFHTQIYTHTQKLVSFNEIFKIKCFIELKLIFHHLL